MYELSKLNATVLSQNNKVGVVVSVEAESHYGYGIGIERGETDYFDIFGLDGEEYGIVSEEGIPIPTTEYTYAWGYEYTESISGEDRSKKITVKVNPVEAVSDETTYKLRIYVRGEGYSSDFEGTTTSGSSKTFTFYIYDYELPRNKDYIILDDNGNILAYGSTYLEHKDTFLDVVVDVLDTTNDNPNYLLYATVYESLQSIGKKILLKGTIG